MCNPLAETQIHTRIKSLNIYKTSRTITTNTWTATAAARRLTSTRWPAPAGPRTGSAARCTDSRRPRPLRRRPQRCRRRGRPTRVAAAVGRRRSDRSRCPPSVRRPPRAAVWTRRAAGWPSGAGAARARRAASFAGRSAAGSLCGGDGEAEYIVSK